MPTVSTDAGAYQDLDRLRERIDYEGHDFYQEDPNAELRFDELLVALERESRGIFETLWGDETPLEETGRVDELRATDDAAIPLVYPINDVSKVERKVAVSSDWKELDSDWYDYNEHRLILAKRPTVNTVRHRQRGNVAASHAERAPWSAIAAKLRVTYDRGFGTEPPADILSVQVRLIENFLADRKAQQTQAAGSPEQLAEQMTAANVVTEGIRQSIDDVTKPGYATISV